MKITITSIIMLLFVTIFSYSQGTWVDLATLPQPTPNLNSVYSLNLNFVCVAGDMGVVLSSSNNGANWVPRGGGPLANSDIYTISCLDSNTYICGGQSPTQNFGYIYKTTNKGQQWTIVFSQPSGWIDDIKMVNASTGFAIGDPVGGRWTILRTTNAGSSWDSSGLRLASRPGEFCWPNGMAIYSTGSGPVSLWFGTNDTLVYRSTNGGTTWQSAPAAQSIYTYCMAFSDASNGFCGGSSFLYKTTNGGLFWQPVAGAPGTGSVLSIAYSSGRYWYTRGTKIYFSTDGGATFALQHTSPSTASYQHLSFYYSPLDNTMSTIGGWGITGDQVVSHYTEANIGIQQIGTEIPVKLTLFQNYPNPFNPSTKIRFDMPAAGELNSSAVHLVVYDMLGRQAAVLVNQVLKPGTYEVDLNAAEYPSGVYFYRLSFGGTAITKQMVLIK